RRRHHRDRLRLSRTRPTHRTNLSLIATKVGPAHLRNARLPTAWIPCGKRPADALHRHDCARTAAERGVWVVWQLGSTRVARSLERQNPLSSDVEPAAYDVEQSHGQDLRPPALDVAQQSALSTTAPRGSGC